eukprot:CAMPEP_0202968852 /NCGR_PEP_ID=MMETSP1396-20130829/14335_1 /ASSEMBLY_ACC=CAM_ASM_000872 /TAXON_ID= /ORGANISM="Pseudokeronopsis sp., Strain Brazil" /LENGTH=82 /DNA_ID=CAMNT_0049695669 /DNA_START=1089 /DNA_END=1337 /DNA_ORIENTATION=+
MGKGLDLSPRGTHIIFAAGTGTMVFIDLVAHLVRKFLGILQPMEQDFFQDEEFKMVMFVSFHQREDAIGLELMEALDRYCKA